MRTLKNNMNMSIIIISITIFINMLEPQCYLRLGKRSVRNVLLRQKDSALLTREVLTHLDKIFHENLNEKITMQGKEIYKRNLLNKKISKLKSVMARTRNIC